MHLRRLHGDAFFGEVFGRLVRQRLPERQRLLALSEYHDGALLSKTTAYKLYSNLVADGRCFKQTETGAFVNHFSIQTGFYFLFWFQI